MSKSLVSRVAWCFFLAGMAIGQPVLSSINPSSMPSGGPTFKLVVIGSGFDATSVVRWNGSGLQTTPLSSTQLSATVDAPRIASPGSASVTVFGPGGTSSALTFSIAPSGASTIASLQPGSAIAGTQGFLMAVSGSNLTPYHVVRWTNGSTVDLVTLFGNPTTIYALVTTSLIANPGTASVSALNTQSAVATNILPFPITSNPVPTLVSLSPTGAVEGASGLTLSCFGAGFTVLSQVRWSGVSQATTFVGTGEVRANISSSLLATPGSVPVTVFNPAPGGGLTSAVNFTVSALLPFVSSISPSSVASGSGAVTLFVSGAGFNPLSVVRLNGSPLPTTFLAESLVTASLGSGQIGAAGSYSISVFNGPPGGGPSNSVALTATNPVPVATSLSPSSIPVGSTTFTLSILGSQFNAQSQVFFGATQLAVLSATQGQLQATVPGALVVASSAVNVTVLNPAPGGGTSASLLFGICLTGTASAGSFESQAPGSLMTPNPDAEGWYGVAGSQKVLPDFVNVNGACLFPTQGSQWCEISNHGLPPAIPSVAPSTPGAFPFVTGTVSEMRRLVVAGCPASGPVWLNVDWRFVTREGPQGSGSGYNDFAQILVLDPISLQPLSLLLSVDTYPPWIPAGGNVCPSGIAPGSMQNQVGTVATASAQLPLSHRGSPVLISVVVANQGDAAGPSSLFIDNLRFTSTPQGSVAGAAFTLIAQTTTGLGNLILSVENVPPSATDVYVLGSTTAAPLGVGTGSFLGIVPDAVTIAILLSPSLPFDFFHYPAALSYYSTFGPVVLPNGTLLGLAGQVYDVTAVALSPLGFFAQAQIRRLIW